MKRALVFLVLLDVVACSTSTPSAPPDAAEVDGALDAPPAEAAVDAGPNLGQCASTFGSALTNKTFGYVDGTLFAIVRPQDQQCPKPNGTHLNLQVKMKGDVYRMLVNVRSDRTGIDPNVAFAEKALSSPLAPPFAEGWYTGVSFDYGADLGLKSTDFVAQPIATLTDTLVAKVVVGDPIRVYATGFLEGGHLIHRNGSGNDGVVVVAPTTAAPIALAFRFADQSF